MWEVDHHLVGLLERGRGEQAAGDLLRQSRRFADDARSLAVHAEIPLEQLRTMIYAYPTFHRGVEERRRLRSARALGDPGPSVLGTDTARPALLH